MRQGKPKPYYVRHVEKELLLLAGLYQDSHVLVITTPASPELSYLHDRMPAIMNPDSEWLNTWMGKSWSKAAECLKPYQESLTK